MKRSKLIVAFLLALLGCVFHLFAGAEKPSGEEKSQAGGALIFKLQAGKTLEEVLALFDKDEVHSHKELSRDLRLYRVVLSTDALSPTEADARLRSAMERMKKSGLVEYVEADSKIELPRQPTSS